jgi:hypothetical protein
MTKSGAAVRCDLRLVNGDTSRLADRSAVEQRYTRGE